MRLPETQNAHHLHAFKKGYRLALDGKPLTSMPSRFRYDRTLRQYYEQGWAQANEEFEAGYKASLETPWRNRIAWLVVLILGSIATAAGLISNIKQEQAEQQALILGVETQQQPASVAVQPSNQADQATETAPSQPSITQASTATADSPDSNYEPQLSLLDRERTTADEASTPPQIETENVIEAGKQSDNTELSLLTSAQRQDLTLNQQELDSSRVKMTEVIDSPILIETAILTPKVENRQATEVLSESVPKHIRQLYFFTQIKGAENSTIYHRWLFKNQQKALIPLKITSNLYRTWSSKRMASAWQGEWTLEVLDAQKRVIHRQNFYYGNR